MRLILSLLRTCEDEVETCGHRVWHIRVGILIGGMLISVDRMRRMKLIIWQGNEEIGQIRWSRLKLEE